MKRVYLAIIGIAVIIFANSVFVLNERQQALIVQFGEVVSSLSEPGLKFKIPLIQEVKFFERRTLNLSAEEKEIIAEDQKRLIVSAFAKYKITSPLDFYRSVRSEIGAQSRLNSILDSSLRHIIGEVPLTSLLTEKRAYIMEQIAKKFNEQVAGFGIEVIDVRIMRADLPKENSDAIFRRMQTDREKEAKEFRAEGNEQAQKIMSQADKERAIILAEAEKDSQIVRGEGDGVAAKNFSSSFSQDPEFFEFYQTMRMYENSFSAKDTKFVLSTDGDLMKYFKGLK